MNTLIRLALVNAVGFSASTVMPLWLGGIAGHFGMPAQFAGHAVLAQIGGAALFNLLTPFVFAQARPLPLARRALFVAAAAYCLAVTASPAIFLGACLVCGAALGVLLNVTNRLMGSTEHVQKGYAVFVLIEVVFATLLFLGGAALIERHGLLALFPAISAIALAAIALLPRLSVDARPPPAGTAQSRPTHRAGAALGLASFALFFIGQASLNSFMPTIGQAAGLDASEASRVIGLGMPFGFAGAMLARLLGERIRPIVAVSAVIVVLGCIAPLVTASPDSSSSAAAAMTLAAATMFCVPYYFAQLGALDRNGRYTACGPAMMLTGVATGPSLAVLLDTQLGLPAVGALSATVLLLSGLLFAASARSLPLAR